MRISCPLCRTVLEDVPSDFGPRPFCSERCKLIDLGNWLGEKYRISRPLQAEDLQAEDLQAEDLEEDSFELK